MVNGDKDTGSGDEVEVVEEEPDERFYDKKKSFFDNISCESTERAKGINSRPNWREERKINTETFGERSTAQYNRQRGYRGRGGYRGGFRGGYRGHYRGGGGGGPMRGGMQGGGGYRGRGGGDRHYRGE